MKQFKLPGRSPAPSRLLTSPARRVPATQRTIVWANVLPYREMPASTATEVVPEHRAMGRFPTALTARNKVWREVAGKFMLESAHGPVLGAPAKTASY